ncbi:MAG: DUF523 domain-containing protein [Cycloclasticus sp.]
MVHISIGISRCLLGDEVRYDGKNKYSSICCEQLASYYKLVPVCPEVEAGLTIPRPAIELIQDTNDLFIKGRDDKSLDVTHRLTTFSGHKVSTLAYLSGYVLTPRSPSCGVHSVTVKSPLGDILKHGENGVFTQELIQQFPSLPIIEEPDLTDKSTLDEFEILVMMYHIIQRDYLTKCIKDSHANVRKFILKINELTTTHKQMEQVTTLLEGESFQRLHRLKVELRDCVSSLTLM